MFKFTESPVITSKKTAVLNILTFDMQQALQLENASIELAKMGGIQVVGVQLKAKQYAIEIFATLNNQQTEIAKKFSNGDIPSLVFEGMIDSEKCKIPASLPNIEELQIDFHCHRLSSRSQILLHIVGHRAFAYDIDNEGKLLRYVANFKGGGHETLSNENLPDKIELSSHSGLTLGPHTEGPYNCSLHSLDGHSPAPSALILTVRWNPKNEPTTVIPISPIINKLNPDEILALTSTAFNFTRSDSFTVGKGTAGNNISILDLYENNSFSMRYNSYRFSAGEFASTTEKLAFEKLNTEIANADIIQYSLQPSSALIINNDIALHCRDLIKDNRRLLLRIFGYSSRTTPIILNKDPLLVQG
jgi:hypothetical protein